MSKPKNRTTGVDSARRAINILLLFGGDTPLLTIDSIVERGQVSAPSAYRFISLLRELDLVEDRGNATYALTPRVFALARNAELAFEPGLILRRNLEDLSETTGEAALLMKRVGEYAVCTELVQTEHAVRLSFTPGQVMPLERGAGPKVLLASMEHSERERYLENTSLEPAQRAALLSEISSISEHGWAISSGEVDEGVWAVAAPVKIGQKTVSVLSVAGPRYRIGKDQEAEIRQLVINHAKEASENLTNFGYSVGKNLA